MTQFGHWPNTDTGLAGNRSIGKLLANPWRPDRNVFERNIVDWHSRCAFGNPDLRGMTLQIGDKPWPPAHAKLPSLPVRLEDTNPHPRNTEKTFHQIP